MRLIGSLIKFFVYLCIILIAAGAALFWFDTGDWLVLPLAQRAGDFFLAPMKLELADVQGSLRNGYTLDGFKLISGDEELFTLNHASVSPDWNSLLKGLDGIPYINNLDLRGVSSDLSKVMALVNHFTKDSASSKISADDGDSDSDDTETSPINLQPFGLSIHDVFFGTDYANLELDALTLSTDGILNLSTKIISHDNIYPLNTRARINFAPIEIISSDWNLGQKSTGRLAGTITPLKARIDLTALSLDELLKFAPPVGIKASGRIDSRIFLDTDSNNVLNASGILSMPRASVMDIPLNFRLPFRWNGGNTIALDDASLNTRAASFVMNASANIDTMNVKAKGKAQNVSLNEIGRMFAPQAGLKGEGGYLDFDVDAVLKGDIFAQTRADVNTNIPVLEAAGIQILRNMTAHVKLAPRQVPKISLDGQAFGGKLFARGEARQSRNGDIKPQAVVSIVNLDMNALARTFPALRSAKPSGRVSATANISENLNIDGKITSDRLSASGYTLTNLLANVNYDTSGNKAVLENFRANFGRGTITASGNVNIKDSTFSAEAEAKNIETRTIPALKDLAGTYGLTASASGKYTDMNSIKAAANLTGRNMAYAGNPIGSVNIPVTYSNNTLYIPRGMASIPGGTINLWGNVGLANASNPVLNLAASTNSINLANIMKDYHLESETMPFTGMVRGNVNIRGTLNTANVNANIYADEVKAGNIIDMPGAALELDGNMKRINIHRLAATVNNANIYGTGDISLNQRNIMDSAINAGVKVSRVNLKRVLRDVSVDLPISGIIGASLDFSGTITKPELDVKVDTITYNNEMFIDDIALQLRSPEENRYLIHAGATVKEFRPEVDVDVMKTGDIWAYQVDTRPADINSILQSFVPDMAGMIKGFATVSVHGDTSPNALIGITTAANEINIIDKLKIQNLSLPVIYTPSTGVLTMRNGTALVSDGLISANANFNQKAKEWSADIEVQHLDFGKLSDPFMPMGALVGSVDVEATARGSYGIMNLSFAEGKFSTTPGYIHKIDILNDISPTGRITFQNIKGSFFWNGVDLYLNPGTGARANAGEPLYRYININGPLGLMGKGLNLSCDGRFDLKLLDQLLGAMKGVFQYMTGTIAQSVLKDIAGRVLGVKSRDYQNVSFTLANSWKELQLLDLTITKSIEDILPIDILNQDQEKQKEETKFNFGVKIPTGPGDKSVEDERPEEQLKQQLIDNIFKMGF